MQLEYDHLVAARLEDVFAFHADPANLARLLDRWPGFTLLAHEGRIEPGCRTRMVQQVAWVLPVVTEFLHTAYEPPRSFSERMVHGPYRRFVHEHEFVAEGEGTRIHDRLRVELPLCYGGEPVMRALFAPWFGRFFAHRHRRLQELVAEGVLQSATQPGPAAKA